MSKEWSYSKLSHDVAQGGGPEIWIKTIKEQSYKSGASDMKKQLVLPLLAAGVGIGALSVIGAQKIKQWLDQKQKEKAITEKEAEDAEKFLIKELSDTVKEMDGDIKNDV